MTQVSTSTIATATEARCCPNCRDMLEGDIDAALNTLRMLPTEGPEALHSRTESVAAFATI